jgi:hypothetical protein
MKKRSIDNLDLFRDFTPPPVVERHDPDRVRAATLPMLLARAIAETLKECGQTRAEIAQAMSEQLGETVTEAMLNKYASTASEQHTIPAHRLVALTAVTEDARILNALLSECGLIAVPVEYEALIRRERAKEARDRLDREISASDAEWKAARR